MPFLRPLVGAFGLVCPIASLERMSHSAEVGCFSGRMKPLAKGSQASNGDVLLGTAVILGVE